MSTETSLIFKTLCILGGQLTVVFGLCALFIARCRRAYQRNEKFFYMRFSARENTRGELDLVPEKAPKKVFEVLLWGWFFVALGMIFTAPDSVIYGLLFMSVSSILMGGILGYLMILMDENDGMRILKLTVLTTFGLGVVGMYSGLDLSPLRIVLLIGLFLLIIWHILDAILSFSHSRRRWGAIFGVALFSVYLLYDFNQLARLNEAGSNDWNTALQLAINLYLDVLNLLLELLGDSSDG